VTRTSDSPQDFHAAPVAPAEALKRTGNVLLRSQIEIERILNALVNRRTTVWAETAPGEKLMLTRLLHVDPQGSSIVVGYSDEKQLNDGLLASKEVTFHAGIERTYLEFISGLPSETVFREALAMRFSFPAALLCSQRREHPRLRVARGTSLRCVADGEGVMPFEADIVDISSGGLGSLLHDSAVHLVAGTILKGCKIVHPCGDALVADLEVCHSTVVKTANGEWASRAGFRFVQRPDGIAKFIGVFVLDLESEI
jgi:flagellar brake protein